MTIRLYMGHLFRERVTQVLERHGVDVLIGI